MPLNNPLKIAPARALVLAMFLSCLAFAGCGITPGPPPAAYALRPELPVAPPGEQVSSGNIQLGINPPQADEALANNRVALLVNNREYLYWKGVTWTNQVPDLIQNWIISAFESDHRVFVSAIDSNGFLADFRLASYIPEFNIIDHGDGKFSAVFALTARLFDLRDGKVTAIFKTRHEQQASGEGIASIMDAFDVVLGKGLKDLVDWTVHHLPAMMQKQ